MCLSYHKEAKKQRVREREVLLYFYQVYCTFYDIQREILPFLDTEKLLIDRENAETFVVTKHLSS